MRRDSSTDWLRDAGWGVILHYLAGGTEPQTIGSKTMSDSWNDRVKNFDVEQLAEQLASIGAGYLMITVGQNSGHYCSPNATYDAIVGITPSKCSTRDAIGDLATALARKGIPLIVYFTATAPGADPVAIEKLEWEWGFAGGIQGDWYVHDGERTGKRLVNFQRKWESVIREWSLRWGTNIHGWWIDGAYFADEMYRFPDEPNFESFAAALRAGNPNSIVAFNPGVMHPVICHTEFEDYTAGEIDAFPVCPGRWVDGAQYHVMSFLGRTWGAGEPRFQHEFVEGYTREIIAREGVITWDVPPTWEGLIPEPFLQQLARLKHIRCNI